MHIAGKMQISAAIDRHRQVIVRIKIGNMAIALALRDPETFRLEGLPCAVRQLALADGNAVISVIPGGKLMILMIHQAIEYGEICAGVSHWRNNDIGHQTVSGRATKVFLRRKKKAASTSAPIGCSVAPA